MMNDTLPDCRHRGRPHGPYVMCRSDKAARIGRGLALLSTCATCPHADAPYTVATLSPDEPHEPQHSASDLPPHEVAALPCQHRSRAPISTETADLCGMRGQSVEVYGCDFRAPDGTQPHPECALHRFCHRQTIPTCFTCGDATV